MSEVNTDISLDVLAKMAARYIWWESVPTALRHPDRIMAQVMNLGDYEDVQTLLKLVGEDRLRCVLSSAEIGQFNERSWTYWHYRLGLAEPGHVPAMPTRKVG